MGHMTEPMTTPTPCQTGQLCTVPKRRDEIYERFQKDQTYSANQAAKDLNAVEDSCDHETHPDDWFEDPGAGYGTQPFWRSQRAKAKCHNECPIRLECLAIAIEDDQQFGIWGGYTADQRAKIRDHRRLFMAGRINETKEGPHAEEEQAGQESPAAG